MGLPFIHYYDILSGFDPPIDIGRRLSVFESPLVKEFLDGRSVTLPDGTVITADQVTSPAPPTPNFLIVDCPSIEFISTIMQSKPLLDALGSPTGEESLLPGLSLVVHLLPEGLFESEEYQRFVQTLNELAREHCRFDKSRILEQYATFNGALLDNPIQHLVVDGTGCLPATIGLYSQAAVLHQCFDRRVYPLPYDMRCVEAKQASEEALKHLPEPHTPVVHAQPQTHYMIRPWYGFTRRPEMPILDLDRLCQDAFEPLYVTRDEAEEQFTVMRAKMAEDGFASNDQNPQPIDSSINKVYPEITFLGTGSSAPNKYRNISGILVQINLNDIIMMDCGEGSLNQIYAMYGPKEAEEILRKLRLILVTHMHADHHGGVFSMALARNRLLAAQDPASVSRSLHSTLLPVLAPPAFARWMTSFAELFHHGPIVNLFVLPNVYHSPCPPGIKTRLCPLNSDSPKYDEWVQLLTSLNLEINPVRVPHTGTSWAYVIRGLYDQSSPEHKWSVVYSGDTPPCEDLIEAGRDCDLLIHEATMIDEHEDLAVRARHSTIGSAIRVGRDMHAKFTLLNHFSQRYGRVPMWDQFIPNVAVTFDLMKIRMDDLKRLPYYVPFYKYAFAKHWDAQKVKTEAYCWRKFREQSSANPDNTAAENNTSDSNSTVSKGVESATA
ncbi:unnamed protein product [Echinostoma caproni]|uniref:ribonuclease Z n=1 Tax=Echinostoma caproni TaxID=27848 RepID=A0A183AHT5_9TREM|nr:unnamed protein product [Echinostoma caproni]